MKNSITGLVILSLLVLMVIGSFKCRTQPDKSIEILKAEGYENIKITGYSMFSCSEDDFYSTGFIAYKNGHKVKGTVCGGFFKGHTIRID